MSEFWFNLFYTIAWPFFNLCHPAKVYGRENIPEGGALYCCNHTKLSDPLYIFFALGRKRHPQVMAKMSLMKTPVLGWILKKCGVFGVDRGKSDVHAIKEALKVLKNDGRLLLFPEGTRYADGDSQGAKTGAAMLALRTGAAIVPIFIPAKKRWFAPTPVVIGTPYYPAAPEGRKPTSEDYEAVANDLMERIFALAEVAK